MSMGFVYVYMHSYNSLLSFVVVSAWRTQSRLANPVVGDNLPFDIAWA